jgi:hypothetical protein
MKFRRGDGASRTTTANETREEIRELAEALSVYGSAMRHLAEREAARPWVAERHPSRPVRLTLLLTPALIAVVAVGIMVPLYGHLHHSDTRHPALIVPQPVVETHARIDDTALMNQIDSELSEDVPDALQPLADLTEQPTNSTASEKNNVTQE